MTDCKYVTAVQSWIAIDIAKDFNVVMVDSGKGTGRSFRVANSAGDHDRFVEFARALPQPCRIGFEATGNYHRPLGYRLVKEGFDVCLISSLSGARFREAMFNSWDKNDPGGGALCIGRTDRYHHRNGCVIRHFNIDESALWFRSVH